MRVAFLALECLKAGWQNDKWSLNRLRNNHLSEESPAHSAVIWVVDKTFEPVKRLKCHFCTHWAKVTNIKGFCVDLRDFGAFLDPLCTQCLWFNPAKFKVLKGSQQGPLFTHDLWWAMTNFKRETKHLSQKNVLSTVFIQGLNSGVSRST